MDVEWSNFRKLSILCLSHTQCSKLASKRCQNWITINERFWEKETKVTYQDSGRLIWIGWAASLETVLQAAKKKFSQMSVSWFVVDFWALCAEKAKPQFETAFSEETSLHLWHPLSGHGSLELKNWDLIFFQSRALWRHFSSVLALRSSSTMLNFFAWYCAFMDITKEKGCWNATAA